MWFIVIYCSHHAINNCEGTSGAWSSSSVKCFEHQNFIITIWICLMIMSMHSQKKQTWPFFSCHADLSVFTICSFSSITIGYGLALKRIHCIHCFWIKRQTNTTTQGKKEHSIITFFFLRPHWLFQNSGILNMIYLLLILACGPIRPVYIICMVNVESPFKVHLFFHLLSRNKRYNRLIVHGVWRRFRKWPRVN